MQARKTLPAGYVRYASLDLSRQKAAVLVLSLASFGLFFGAVWLLLRLLPLLRPDVQGLTFSVSELSDLLVFVLASLGVLVLMVVLHEGLHGLLFWIFTRERPVFGWRGLYAYASAPGWYFSRRQHIAGALAPLVLITLLGLLLALVVPEPFLLPLLLLITTNIGGAVGDLLLVGWLLLQSPETLVQDTGDVVTVYRMAEPVGQEAPPHQQVLDR